MNVFRVNITVYDPAIPGTKTLRFATKGHTTPPTATPPDVTYLPLLIDPGTYQQMMFAEGTTSGDSEVGFGQIEVHNKAGILNGVRNYGVAGRQIVIEEVHPKTFALIESHTLTMEQPVFAGRRVTFRLRDRQAELDVPLQGNKYQGDNANGEGLEGEDDLTDTDKPLMYGYVSNATPVCVNRPKQIYQANDGAVNSGGAVVAVRAALLTRGDDYTDQADMLANGPDPLTVRWWPVGGYFRLGTAPDGPLTFSAVEGATAADRTAAQIVKRMVLRAPTIMSDDLTAASFTALDTLNGAGCGLFNKGETIKGAVAKVLNSIGGWSGFDTHGKFAVGRLNAPGAAPLITLKAAQIQDVECLATNDPGRGVPPWSVSLNYDHNDTIQTDNLVANIGFYGWTKHIAPFAFNSIAYGAGVHIGVGNSGVIGRSTDGGETWSPVSLNLTSMGLGMGFSENWRSVAYGNDTFVMVGDVDVVLTSTDGGETWSGHSIAGYTCTAVAFDGAVFIAALDGESFAALTSAAGVTWTPRALPSGLTYYEGRSIASGGGITMIVGGSHTLVSYDAGVTWAVFDITVSGHTNVVGGRVIYAGNFFVIPYLGAVNSLFYSAGVGDWHESPIAAFSLAEYYGYTPYIAAHAGKIYIAVGELYSSPDDIGFSMTWTTEADLTVFQLAEANGILFASYITHLYVLAPYNPEAKRQWLAKECRTITRSDSAVQTVHLTSKPLTIDTRLTAIWDAQAEAARQLALRKVCRDPLKLTVKRSALPVAPQIGAELYFTLPLWGYAGGKQVVIMGFYRDRKTNDYIIYGWG
jgi:hypothetical protein